MSSSEDEIEFVCETKSSKKNNDITVSSDDNNQSNNEDDEDIDMPSGAECLSRCKQFAEITGTDTALAMFYLQDTKWDLEKGLNSYYQATNSANSKVVACFDVDQLNEDEKRNSNKRKSNSSDDNRKVSKSSDQKVCIDSSDNEVDKDEENENSKNTSIEDDSDDKFFKVLSWNIDGLDKSNIESRALGVVKKILDEKPAIVLLQEVIRQNETILKEKLNDLYEFTSGNTFDSKKPTESGAIEYYTAILTRRKLCSVKSKNIIHFTNSVMGRNLLQVMVNYKNTVEICVMTAHLESTTEFSKQRTEQLKRCFKEMLEQDPKCLVIFGGDLNLRDSELSAIGGLPNQIYDMWESTGSRKECLYTWDCSRNTNLKMNGKFKPRCRFDRLYYRPILNQDSLSRQVVSEEPSFTLMPVYFELEGLEKLKSCGRFCSDHWAIQSYCQLEINKAV